MQIRSAIRNPRSAIPDGFTLIELLVVMVIISIILVFIVNAGIDAQHRAQERATQALITKLDVGLSDRLEALLLTRPDYNNAHLAMAAIANQNAPAPIAGNLRASVIAWYDYVKSEMPDVFYIQSNSGPYPFNFAAYPYPGTPIDSGSLGLGNFVLPLGNSVAAPLGSGNVFNQAGTGIFGASYPAAAGLYKNIGYLPTGYDGVDNDGNGYVDDWKEGVGRPSNNWQADATIVQTVQANLANHTHITARSEMLYALLVEGRGPLGSIFNRDDFTDNEVKDTDQDGLPEFVDAWGQPLQFFRWPLLYHSDLQRGQMIVSTGENTWTLVPPYSIPTTTSASASSSMLIQREQDPLDLNQQLMAPAWWGGYNNVSILGISGPSSALGASPGVQAFESFFHRLTEPIGGNGGGFFWDRGSTYGGRRAFYSKFLIVSGGLDQQLGVFLYPDTQLNGLGANAATALIANENNALPFSIFDGVANFTSSPTVQSTSISYNPSLDPTTPSSSDLIQSAQDDISNQNIQITVGIGGSG
ncbi:MAG: type II secretion system protein [Isosphaeraceae bacterium]